MTECLRVETGCACCANQLLPTRIAAHQCAHAGLAALRHAALHIAALLPFGAIQALMAVPVAAVGKEVWDAQGHGTPDNIDALVTVIGGVLMRGWLHLAPLITRIF